MLMGLETYQKMRDFRRTPEPRGSVSKANRRRFVVQEHHASKLHFDFRLEMGGVLKSWSLPKGPSLDPREKRLAVPTEDHPVEYLKFEGHIPEGEYGAGEHFRWDEGTYHLLDGDDPLEQLEGGRMRFELRGSKLRGVYRFFKLKGRDHWLLVKSRDEHAEHDWELQLRREPAPDESGKKRQKKSSGPHEAVRKYSTEKKAEGGKVLTAGRAFGKKSLAGDVNVRVGGHVVPLSSLDKPYWPEEGITKGDLIRYYHEVSDFVVPYLKDRPVIMKRYPNGVGGKSFHQHDVNEAPDFVRTETLATEEDGHEVDYVVCDDAATSLWMANLGAIERHPWHSRVASLDHPDWVVFDLDPGEGVEFATICDVALALRGLLERLGLESYPKTSGSRGLHVYVPAGAAHEYEEVAKFAERVATLVARERPDAATVERSLKKRGAGLIYVDHLQNARGKSVVAPYSVRPRPGATVSTPLEWKEVERAKIMPRDFTMKNLLRRVERKGDPFAPVLEGRQDLKGAFEEARRLAGSRRR